MPLNDEACFVFIHQGGTPPSHIVDAISQCRAFNNAAIYFVTEARNAASLSFPTELKVQIVELESLPPSQKRTEFINTPWLERSFRHGFWTYTTERFFVLESLMETRGLRDVIHLENDVLIYFNSGTMLPALRSLQSGIGATFDTDDRCIPGIIYFRDTNAFSNLTTFILDHFRTANQHSLNDMMLLGAFRRSDTGIERMDPLPIVPVGYTPLKNLLGVESAEPDMYSRNFNKFGGVFDGAAIGQFLAGIDPRNSNNQDTRGFINESSMFNPSSFEYILAPGFRGIPIPYMRKEDTVCPVFNLHIHSKNLAAYSWR